MYNYKKVIIVEKSYINIKQDLLDAFNNILSNPELKNRFDKIKKPDDVYAVFKDAGYPGSSEELDQEIRAVVEEFVKSKKAREGDLSGVAGGKGAGFSKKIAASALALMGIASTASGNALHALHGSSFENAKFFVEKQMKNPAVKNALGYGVTAVGSVSLGGILMWALMRNQKSPHLQKIYKYATSANDALVKFKTTMNEIKQSEDQAEDSELDIDFERMYNEARKVFKDKMLGIIGKMESDKLFLDSWDKIKGSIYEKLDDDDLNSDDTYKCACNVFFHTNISYKNLKSIIDNKYSDSDSDSDKCWKKFYNQLYFYYNNTDLKSTYMDKEMFENSFNYSKLSNIIPDELRNNDLFCSISGVTQSEAQEVQNTTNTAILAEVYQALQEHNPEQAYTAFVQVLKKMRITKKFFEGNKDLFHNVNKVFKCLRKISKDEKFAEGFKGLYNFLVKNGESNSKFIDLIRQIVQNGIIKYSQSLEISKYAEDFNNDLSSIDDEMLCGSFIENFRKLLKIANDSVYSDGNFKYYKCYQYRQRIIKAKNNKKKYTLLANLYSEIYSGQEFPSISDEELERTDDFNQLIEQTLFKAMANHCRTTNTLVHGSLCFIEAFQNNYFEVIKNGNIILGNMLIDKNALDIFD